MRGSSILRESARIAVLALTLLIALNAYSATRLLIFPTGQQGTIIIQRLNLETGRVDSDPDTLYDLLDLPERTLPSGDKGKIFESSDKSMIFTCVERGGTGHRQCQVIVNKSEFSRINPVGQFVEFHLVGPEAQKIFRNFKETRRGSFEFTTSDDRTQMYATPSEVIIKAK